MSATLRVCCAIAALTLAGQSFGYYGREDEKAMSIPPEQSSAELRLTRLRQAIDNDAFGICLATLGPRDIKAVRWLLESVSEITPRVMHTLVLLSDRIAILSACSIPNSVK